MYEHINKMLGKISNLTYDDVRERYEHFRARCTQKNVKDKIFKYKKTSKTKEKGNGCTATIW